MRRIVLAMSLLSVLALRPAAQDPAAPPKFGETMTVVRYQVEARVTDAAGKAVRSLSAADFEVTIGKAPAEVEAADWIGTSQRPEVALESDGTAGAGPLQQAAEGRLVVFFVQTDFGRNRDRILGQMAFNANMAEKVVGMMQPQDRIAVLSFDSHLKLRCDFSSDRTAALDAIRAALEIGPVAAIAVPADGPSLVAHLDAREMKAVTRAEPALLLVARALSEIEGDKLMILPGWGFGEMSWGKGAGGDRLVLSREWREAVGVLHRDHVPVITIGTGAGQLTMGIAMTARATGGIHTSTIGSFPEQSLGRIEGALAGYYELLLRVEVPLAAGEHVITIRARDLQLRVHATPVIVVGQLDTLYADAIELLNAGQIEAGLGALRESIATREIPADVLMERLRMFKDAAHWEAALVIVEQLEAAGPVDDDLAAIRDEARRSLALRRTWDAHARLTEARRLLLAGEADRPLALLNEAVEVEPRLADAWYERGMLLLSLGRTEEAKASLRRYIELDPRGAGAATAKEVLAGLEPAP
ncbi:MAG: tetratricopeptide repeat protein [Thermoanaerobaculia bacterium]